MKNKYVLEKEDKYTGNRGKNLRKALIYFVTVIITGVTLLLEGCFFPEKANAIEPEDTFTPAAIVTMVPSSTPTVKPTIETSQTPNPTVTIAPTPSPTATPESTPIPFEEKIEMMEVYDGKDKNALIAFNTIGFIDYTIAGEKKIMIVGIGVSTDPTDGKEKTYMWNVVDLKRILFYDENIMENRGQNGVDYFSGLLPYTEGYKGKELKLNYIGSVRELEDYLKNMGISVPETEYSSKINNPKATGGMSPAQFAEYLAKVLPDNLYAFPSELNGQNEYGTPSPTK